MPVFERIVLKHQLPAQISSYCRGSRNLSFYIATRNRYGNLNTFTISSIIGGSFCESHSSNIVTKHIVTAGQIINQIKFIICVVILISYIISGRSNQGAFIHRRAGFNCICCAKLACYPEQGLSGTVDYMKDVLVLSIIYNRGVKGSSYGSEQYACYCQGKQQFHNGKTSFVFPP